MDRELFRTIRQQAPSWAWPPTGVGKVRAGADAVLAALLGIQAAALFWVLATPSGPFGDPSPTASSAGLAVLDRLDPFFRTGVRSELTDAAASGAAALRLFGTRAGGAGGGSAIIGAADGRQGAYRPGDEIEPGLVLTAVADDHVILSRGGGRTRLAFVESAVAVEPPPPPTTPEVIGPSTAASPVAVDPARLMAEASLSPRLRDGQIAGYALQVRGAGDSVRAAGLRSGDILLSVNGQPLDGPERLAGLRAALAGAPSAEIRFERAGHIGATTVRIAAR